jgi:hypothetical protein
MVLMVESFRGQGFAYAHGSRRKEEDSRAQVVARV